MSDAWNKNSSIRIFSFSAVLTAIILMAVLLSAGPIALMIAVALIVIEIIFSLDNAIINAKVLQQLSPFWQKIFLTIGIAVAVFGMRIIFPIALVAATSSIAWQDVVSLSLNDPQAYSHALERAEPSIAAFGGAFLLMLSLHFFMNPHKRINWLGRLERVLARARSKWLYAAVAAAAVYLVSLMPSNPDPGITLRAGLAGIITYLILHGLSDHFMPSMRSRVAVRTGTAGFIGFLYLEVLDASFSLDSVIGAFALTNKVLLIAAGLGVGAIWVRSLTVYMTRNRTLNIYRYLEHGAHWAIAVLGISLLADLIINIPEGVTGVVSLLIIIASVIASEKANRETVQTRI
jgi:hypothetical protein